jgi:AAA domain
MIEIITERMKRPEPSLKVLPFIFSPGVGQVTQIPLLVIEARPSDGSAFNRGYYYRTLLSLMGERTYQQHIHIDIHGERDVPKRRKVTGKAAQFNDLPELQEAAEEAMRRHGVRVIIVDEAHHMMYTGNGGATVTLQEQLEWLKSMSNTTHVLHILVGTYDLLQFGKLNGQTARRSLPVHFPRYQLQREEDCIEFQAALLALLQKVPLPCDTETFVSTYWIYFYECSIGCIGVLKDWLLRAVSTALDEGQETLTLDWIQDHAPQTDVCRQMALDAIEGEQKLHHTESNREHLWRLLQGGELVAPIPPLPPRATVPLPLSFLVPNQAVQKDEMMPSPAESADPLTPTPPVKKTRSRKKVEVPHDSASQEMVAQDTEIVPNLVDPPKRRRKKADAPPMEDPESRATTTASTSTETASELIDAKSSVSSPKPKRTRRIGEPKPKRYAVGEPKAEHNL